MHGRYKPFKDLFHYECWRTNGGLFGDYTNRYDYQSWSWWYYPRRHKNIPSDENMYDLKSIWFGMYTDTLWDYT